MNMGEIKIISKKQGTGIYKSDSHEWDLFKVILEIVLEKTLDIDDVKCRIWEYLKLFTTGHLTESEESIVINTCEIEIDEELADKKIIISKKNIHAITPDFITYEAEMLYGKVFKLLLSKSRVNNNYELKSKHEEGFYIKFEAESNFIDTSQNKDNFNPNYSKTQFLDNSQLPLLYQAISKDIFTKPKMGSILTEALNDNGVHLYFDQEYYNDLMKSINKAKIDGKFAESNMEYRWLQLIDKIDNAINVTNPDISKCKIYLSELNIY